MVPEKVRGSPTLRKVHPSNRCWNVSIKNQHYAGTRGKVRPRWTLTYNHLWYNDRDLICWHWLMLGGLSMAKLNDKVKADCLLTAYEQPTCKEKGILGEKQRSERWSSPLAPSNVLFCERWITTSKNFPHCDFDEWKWTVGEIALLNGSTC